MRIAILGATGGTGRAVLQRALRAGHAVTALVRDPARLDITTPDLTLHQGDVHQFNEVKPVIADADAVFVSLGIAAELGNDQTVTVCTIGIRNVLEAMELHGVSRLVAMSTYSANESDDGSEYAQMLKHHVTERVRDKESMEVLIRASRTRWTIIRPPEITPAAPRGDYRITLKLDFSSLISHDNLSSFVLTELTQPSYSYQAFSITE